MASPVAHPGHIHGGHMSSAAIPCCANHLLHKVNNTWCCFVFDLLDENSFQSLSEFHVVSQASRCLKDQCEKTTNKSFPVQHVPSPVSENQRLPLNEYTTYHALVD